MTRAQRLGSEPGERQEIRRDQASVKHQELAGSNIDDDHKEYFLGEKALLAGGAANTMNQFQEFCPALPGGVGSFYRHAAGQSTVRVSVSGSVGHLEVTQAA